MATAKKTTKKPAAKKTATASKSPTRKTATKHATTTKPPVKATTKAAGGQSLKAGDPVEWDSSGGKSVGTVVKKVTTTTKIKSHVAKATPGHPEYLVKSAKSGKPAVHKAGELRKKSK